MPSYNVQLLTDATHGLVVNVDATTDAIHYRQMQPAQPLAANHPDRGCQAGPAMESAVGGAACSRTGMRTPQPRHAGRGAQTRRLSPGGRQKPSALPNACAVGRADTKSCLRSKTLEPSGDPPAVPRHLGDWAEEFLLPMLLTVCIEAGRKTLTHTSWTGLTPVSQMECLASLPLWPLPRIARRSPTHPSRFRFETPLFQASGNLRLLLTSTYHWMSRIPPRHPPDFRTWPLTSASP